MFTAVALSAALVGCTGSEPPSLTSGWSAFIAHDLHEARRIYLAIPDTVDPQDRVQARIRLAALEWRVFQDTAAARAHLQAGLTLGVDGSSVFSEWARLEAARGEFGVAVGRARAALGLAETERDRVRAVIRLAEAAVAAAERAVLEDARPPDPDEASRLEEALEHLRPLVRSSPGLAEPARLLLSAALLLDLGNDAWEAWRSYYVAHLDRGGPLPGSARTLSLVLPRWAGPEASPSERAAVVRSLAESAFPGPALLLLSDPRSTGGIGSDPELADLEAYARFLREVEVTTDAYYRDTSLGRGDPEAYRAELLRLAGSLWTRIRWDGTPVEFTVEAFVAELRSRFGAEVNLGSTAGYFDLHMGHVVVDEPRTIEQHGHRAELRYVALDGMTSNGFQSWAWDGAQAHGGWATADTIFQVRPEYAAGPANAWRALTDPEERERRATRERADSLGDAERARRNPHAYLPGLAARIRRQGLESLRDSLAAGGLEGAALQAAFLASYDAAVTESSVFAHEGRHAIDRRLGIDVGLEEREFRAKLSEVVFASLPRLALGAILNPDIGNTTPHGEANRRIMEGLVSWIETHEADVVAFDAALPSLPQLSLLSDAQLRAAFRSMDPLARD